MSNPLAYFITFTTYGTWLHGKDPQSVDRSHNVFGLPFSRPNENREKARSAQLQQNPYQLEDSKRQIVLETILEVALFRNWTIWAIHVRSNHVHVVITASVAPEKVMSDLKAYCSRRIRERTDEQADRNRWTRHGSKIWINDDKGLQKVIEYVLECQGEAMNRYPEIREKEWPNEPKV
ncbi:MAG: transposase [Planctomycetota bacterium]